MKKLITITAILLCIINAVSAEELIKQQSKYPDYAYMYLGPDKFEKMNRKIFRVKQICYKACTYYLEFNYA